VERRGKGASHHWTGRVGFVAHSGETPATSKNGGRVKARMLHTLSHRLSQRSSRLFTVSSLMRSAHIRGRHSASGQAHTMLGHTQAGRQTGTDTQTQAGRQTDTDRHTHTEGRHTPVYLRGENSSTHSLESCISNDDAAFVVARGASTGIAK